LLSVTYCEIVLRGYVLDGVSQAAGLNLCYCALSTDYRNHTVTAACSDAISRMILKIFFIDIRQWRLPCWRRRRYEFYWVLL